MTAHSHTPGPWKVMQGSRGGPGNLYELPEWISDTEGHPVCIMGSQLSTYANAENNARLIAAAPDLLDILTQLVELRGQVRYESIIWKEAIAVIAKYGGAA